MVGLAEKCMHPTRNEPYMKSHGGGRDNSPEGQQVARILSSPFTIVGSICLSMGALLTAVFLASLGSFHSRLYLRVSECRG